MERFPFVDTPIPNMYLPLVMPAGTLRIVSNRDRMVHVDPLF